MIAAIRKPLNPTSTMARASAQPLRATRMPRLGVGRVPNGSGGMAG
jgi:hypothetical protein